MQPTHRAVAVLAVAAVAILACPRARAAAPRVKLSTCSIPGVAGDARCGTYEVPENRSAPQGRKVSLRVVVLPATGSDRLPDPVVDFAGGPGDSAVEEAAAVAQIHGSLRARRDIVLIDLRGTGGSAPLGCPGLAGERGVQGFLEEFLPAAAVRECHAAHGDRDLAQYRTAVAIDDVAEVLTALGYDRVNAVGGSYGTRSALELLRRHPQRVRTLGLLGLVPPDARSPLTFARDAQEALDGTLRECAAEPACAKAFPRVREELAAILAQLEREPAPISVRDPQTGEAHELRLTRHGFAQTVRYMLYVPASALQIPLYVHAAASGDFQPIGETAAFFARMAGGLSDGFFLSVTCAEDVPFIGEAEASAAVRGNFLGDFRIRAQQAACREWRVPRVAAAELEPIRGEAPALLLSGERDPVTPARWGEQVARTLPNAVHLVIPDGGHGVEGLRGADCAFRLFDQLVEKGTARGLDTACLAAIERPPFALELPAKGVELAAEQRSRVLGRYEGGGLAVVVDAVGDRLRLSLVGGEKSFLLVAQSAARFGLEGLPPAYAVEVVETEGKVTALRVIGLGDEPMVLPRVP